MKFQDHKVQMSLILSGIERFRTLMPVWIHRWLSNDLQRLKLHRRGALLFVNVIHQISRSHRTETRQFWPIFSISGLWLQFEFTNGFGKMHKAWCSTEEVSYCFSRSSIKFEGHMDRKIDDLNPILSKISKLVAAIKSLRFALFLNEFRLNFHKSFFLWVQLTIFQHWFR